MLRRMLLAALGTLLAFGLIGCTPQEPEFTPDDQVRAQDREDEPGDGDGDNDVPGPGGTVTFVAIDIDFEDEDLSTQAGSVTFELINSGVILHDVTIEELNNRTIVEAEGGATDTATVTLEPGTYTFYCSVPGHRTGMEGTLTVS